MLGRRRAKRECLEDVAAAEEEHKRREEFEWCQNWQTKIFKQHQEEFDVARPHLEEVQTLRKQGGPNEAAKADLHERPSRRHLRTAQVVVGGAFSEKVHRHSAGMAAGAETDEARRDIVRHHQIAIHWQRRIARRRSSPAHATGFLLNPSTRSNGGDTLVLRQARRMPGTGAPLRKEGERRSRWQNNPTGERGQAAREDRASWSFRIEARALEAGAKPMRSDTLLPSPLGELRRRAC